MKVLVTGGSGLCGKALQRIRPDWIYIDSKTYGSLTKLENVQKMFSDAGPDIVVHLAANVGGILKNMNNKVSMYEDNILMNTFVLGEAARSGVSKIVNILSTCIFPDDPTLELTPGAIHAGPPHPTNAGYAYAKRMSYFHSQNLPTKVVNLIPTNLYGPHDNFSLDSGHVIPALIRKASEGRLEVRGTGKALRQFLHVDDFARVIVWAVEECTEAPNGLICAPEEEYSIKTLAVLIGKEFGQNPIFIDGPDGQMRKYAVPGDFPRPVISLEEGISSTIKWFNYKISSQGTPNSRGFD
jgi:GDP-L-fucose synthase